MNEREENYFSQAAFQNEAKKEKKEKKEKKSSKKK